MEPYYVYILRCRDGSLYTGITNDVAHRLRLHRSGKGAKYTRAHPPEAVAAVWRCGGKAEAARLEYAIKATLTHASGAGAGGRRRRPRCGQARLRGVSGLHRHG